MRIRTGKGKSEVGGEKKDENGLEDVDGVHELQLVFCF